MVEEIEIKEVAEVDFVLRSLGTYLKVPQEVKAQFNFDIDVASPRVQATQEKGVLNLTYSFSLDKEGKVRKQLK